MADHAGDGLPRLTDQATQQADDGVSQAGEHLGAMALSNLAAVLIERDIADPMEAVPIPTIVTADSTDRDRCTHRVPTGVVFLR